MAKSDKSTEKPATELAKTGPTTVAAYDYGEMAGDGFEGQSAQDITIPWLNVLQAMSPQVQDNKPEGARQGHLYNTVTEQLFDGKEGVLFVPALTEHTYVEWRPRDKGGGFVAKHAPDSQLVLAAVKSAEKFGKNKTPDGNDLNEAFYIYGAQCMGDEILPVILAFTSTKIKAYKNWSTKVNMFQQRLEDGRKVRPPMYAHLVRITTWTDKNPSGTFANVTLAPANGSIPASLLGKDDPRLRAAAEVKALVQSGTAKVDYTTQDKASGAPAGDEADAPF